MEAFNYIYQDFLAFTKQLSLRKKLQLFRYSQSDKIIIYFRAIQYILEKEKNTKGFKRFYLSATARLFNRRYSKICNSLNVFLPVTTSIGKGLRFPHGFPLVINPEAEIGDFCTIHPCVLIGRDRGKSGHPIIGSYCFIGHGAKIIGNPIIGDWCFISPAAVITKDVPAGSCVGAGINNILNNNGENHVKLYLS